MFSIATCVASALSTSTMPCGNRKITRRGGALCAICRARLGRFSVEPSVHAAAVLRMESRVFSVSLMAKYTIVPTVNSPSASVTATPSQYRRSSLRLMAFGGEPPVSGAAQGFDVAGVGRVVAQLGPQGFDVIVHRAGRVVFRGIAPHVPQKLAARNGLARPARQIIEQFKFAVGQRYARAVLPRLRARPAGG